MSPGRLQVKPFARFDEVVRAACDAPEDWTPIGRTVLRHYGLGNNRRYDPVVRRYVAHIAGLRLVFDALPFFQQERAVGACATAALWSALSSAARNNGMRAPMPHAVTAAATKNMVTDRPLPATSGLELAQFANASRALISRR